MTSLAFPSSQLRTQYTNTPHVTYIDDFDHSIIPLSSDTCTKQWLTPRQQLPFFKMARITKHSINRLPIMQVWMSYDKYSIIDMIYMSTGTCTYTHIVFNLQWSFLFSYIHVTFDYEPQNHKALWWLVLMLILFKLCMWVWRYLFGPYLSSTNTYCLPYLIIDTRLCSTPVGCIAHILVSGAADTCILCGYIIMWANSTIGCHLICSNNNQFDLLTFSRCSSFGMHLMAMLKYLMAMLKLSDICRLYTCTCIRCNERCQLHRRVLRNNLTVRLIWTRWFWVWR